MFDYGLRALGSLVIGIGVLPFVAGLTAILTRRRDPDRNVRAFVLTSLAALFTFGFYTAVKAAYISTEFATVTVERNLIYVAPLLFAGTALLLERPGRRFGVLRRDRARRPLRAPDDPVRARQVPLLRRSRAWRSPRCRIGSGLGRRADRAGARRRARCSRSRCSWPEASSAAAERPCSRPRSARSSSAGT